jgi:hypothetical protein
MWLNKNTMEKLYPLHNQPSYEDDYFNVLRTQCWEAAREIALSLSQDPGTEEQILGELVTQNLAAWLTQVNSPELVEQVLLMLPPQFREPFQEVLTTITNSLNVKAGSERETELDRILSPQSGASAEEFANAFDEKSRIVSDREFQLRREE